MQNRVRDRRAQRARGVLLCALLIGACGGGDESNPSPSPQGGDMDAGIAPGDGSLAPGDGGLAPGEGRIGPDGAVQIRAQPDPDCNRAVHTSGSYWLCSTLQQASTAIGTCWSAGGTLAKIDDADENEFLTGEMIEEVYFIGYSDADVDGEWIWPDGSSGGYENWAEGEPGDADFSVIQRDGTWATSTDEPRPYICEDWK